MSNKVRFTLTALGMVIGTASLILVTTVGLPGWSASCSAPFPPSVFPSLIPSKVCANE